MARTPSPTRIEPARFVATSSYALRDAAGRPLLDDQGRFLIVQPGDDVPADLAADLAARGLAQPA